MGGRLAGQAVSPNGKTPNQRKISPKENCNIIRNGEVFSPVRLRILYCTDGTDLPHHKVKV